MWVVQMKNFQFFSAKQLITPFPLSTQNDHLAANRQAEDPSEQSPGVPPEVHPAVLLKPSLTEGGT